MRFTPIAVTPCSTRFRLFGRGSASSSVTGSGGGGGWFKVTSISSGVAAERRDASAPELTVHQADPQRLADLGAVHAEHLRVPPAVQPHAVGMIDEVVLEQDDEIHSPAPGGGRPASLARQCAGDPSRASAFPRMNTRSWKKVAPEVGTTGSVRSGTPCSSSVSTATASPTRRSILRGPESS